MARITKKDIFAAHGVQFRSNGRKVYCDILDQWIPLPLINGNKKIGKTVWQWSITAGNKAVSDEVAARVIESTPLVDMDRNQVRVMCGGTCRMDCPGCYAQTGCYLFFSTRLSIARKTLLIHLAMVWIERVISAQIEADHIEYCRIHVAGDFFSNEYVEMWTRIAAAHPETCFWTYTKQRWDSLEKFNALPNCNIVKSLANGGVNYGKAGYIMNLYHELQAAGKSVYICRCGIDSNQHCAGCHHCFTSEYVLFLEHGTGYNPETDPDFAAFIELVNSQIERAA